MCGGKMPSMPSPTIQPRPDAAPRPLDEATMRARDDQLAKEKQKRGLAGQFKTQASGSTLGAPKPQQAVNTLLGGGPSY